MSFDYQAVFQSFEKKRSSNSPSWLGALRRSAFSRFTQIGFPTVRDEDWRLTNIEPFVKDPFHFVFDPSPDGLTTERIPQFFLGPEKEGDLLVFINGFLSKEFSRISEKDSSLRIGSLTQALQECPEIVRNFLGKIVPYERNGFTALNTALFQDGAFVYLGEGKSSERPLCLLFITSPPQEHWIAQPRNLIVLEAGARALLFESYVSFSTRSYFTNVVTEIVLKKKAHLDHYKIQKEAKSSGCHVATTQIQLEEGSRFLSTAVSLGAKLGRENLNVTLNNQETECTLNGLYLVSEGQHTDHHTRVDHLKPRGTSRQLYKGILKGKGTAVFNGKIYVHQNAQKSDAEQINKNLLLSEQATIHTKPELEILHDDVKCTHGAAVGQIDEDQLFYLRSRGIQEKKAHVLLTQGFAREITDRIKMKALQEGLERLVLERLEE